MTANATFQDADARAMIRADLERLGGPARARYRAALRRLLREARDERGPARQARTDITQEDMAMLAVGGLAVATAAILGGPAAGALAGACAAGALALAMIRGESGAPRPAPRFLEDDHPAAMAISLHRAALAESRRDYYAGPTKPRS